MASDSIYPFCLFPGSNSTATQSEVGWQIDDMKRALKCNANPSEVGGIAFDSLSSGAKGGEGNRRVAMQQCTAQGTKRDDI